MKTHSPIRSTRGFSLIEVLIAVVILSVGLLALASLQMNLIRSSAETKTQSTAMALAKEKLEQLASYRTLGGADNACTSPSAGGSNTCYRAINSETLAAIDIDPVTAGNQSVVGGVSFQRGTTVTRYVYDKLNNQYYSVGNTLLDSAVKALTGHTYLPGKEFKRVVATVSWTDANGATQSIQVEDALSGVEPADTIALSKNKGSGAARKAISIITNPASIAGVIPVAIGNGSDTAATNPRPILLSQGNSSTLVETRFDIYTYAALNNSAAQAQSRVETSVIGCTCSTGTGTHAAYRPTYWNGDKYVSPDTANGIPVSTPKSGVDQSALCTACCRDHQDPTGVAGEKFDPRRTTHNHYLAANLATPVTMGTAGSDYNEACRLIRVDGIFRVAAEPYDDYFALVGTAGLNQSSPTTTVTGAVPGTGTGSLTEAYQAYVINYLQARYIDGTEANYNTPLDPSTVTGASTLDTPANASIGTTSSPQYLHARGLIVDYLSDALRARITAAKNTANCKGTDGQAADTTAEIQACVFKLLPFTSINLTELANWTSTTPTKVELSNADFKTTVGSLLPIRGKAAIKAGAATGDTARGVASIQRTSAGLAVAPPVFPGTELPTSTLDHITGDDSVLTDSNNQNFTVGSGNVTPSNEYFITNLFGSDLLAVIDLSNKPKVRFSISVGSQVDCVDGDLNGDGDLKPDEFRCTPNAGDALGGSVSIDVGNYNRNSSVSIGNACTNNSNDTIAMPIKKLFDVSSFTQQTVLVPGIDANNDGDYLDPGDTAPIYNAAVSLGAGTPVNNGSIGDFAANGEYTSITVNPLSDRDIIGVNFSNVVYRCPSNWNDYINNNGSERNLTTSQKNDNLFCGSGSNKGPQWSSTYGSCPNGFAPFQ